MRVRRLFITTKVVKNAGHCDTGLTEFTYLCSVRTVSRLSGDRWSAAGALKSRPCPTGDPRRERGSPVHAASIYFVQSSIFKCFSRRKERSLVTKTASAANACAAIIMSKFPIGIPFISSVVRKSA